MSHNLHPTMQQWLQTIREDHDGICLQARSFFFRMSVVHIISIDKYRNIDNNTWLCKLWMENLHCTKHHITKRYTYLWMCQWTNAQHSRVHVLYCLRVLTYLDKLNGVQASVKLGDLQSPDVPDDQPILHTVCLANEISGITAFSTPGGRGLTEVPPRNHSPSSSLWRP